MFQHAVHLNTYRINFGSDSSNYEQLEGNEAIPEMPNTTAWYIEIAIANLAWNITRVHLHLEIQGNLNGKLDNDLAITVNTLERMTSVPRRDSITEAPFPSNLPVELYAWHVEQPPWITPDNMQNRLHESSFYEENTLLDFVDGTRKRVWKIRRPEDLEDGEVEKSKGKGEGANSSSSSEWSGLEEFSSDLDAAIESNTSAEPTPFGQSDADSEMLDGDVVGPPEPKEPIPRPTEAENSADEQTPIPEVVDTNEEIESDISMTATEAEHGWNANIPLLRQKRSTRNKNPNYRT